MTNPLRDALIGPDPSESRIGWLKAMNEDYKQLVKDHPENRDWDADLECSIEVEQLYEECQKVLSVPDPPNGDEILRELVRAVKPVIGSAPASEQESEAWKVLKKAAAYLEGKK